MNPTFKGGVTLITVSGKRIEIYVFQTKPTLNTQLENKNITKFNKYLLNICYLQGLLINLWDYQVISI